MAPIGEGEGSSADQAKVVGLVARVVDDLRSTYRGLPTPSVALRVQRSPTAELRSAFIDSSNSIVSRRDVIEPFEYRTHQGQWDILLPSGGEVTAVTWVEQERDSSYNLVRIADAIQQYLLEELQIVAPECPYHSHPLWPRHSDRVAEWVCPAIPSLFSCLIGELSSVLKARFK
jgi:hypothetical protein